MSASGSSSSAAAGDAVISLESLVDRLYEARFDVSSDIRLILKGEKWDPRKSIEGILEGLYQTSAIVRMSGGKEARSVALDKLTEIVYHPRSIFLLDRLGVITMRAFFERCKARGYCRENGCDLWKDLIRLLPFAVSSLLHTDKTASLQFLCCLLNSCFQHDGDNETATQMADRVLSQFLHNGQVDVFRMINECQTLDEDVVQECHLHCLNLLLRMKELYRHTGFPMVAELLVPLEAEEVSRFLVKVLDNSIHDEKAKLNQHNLSVVIRALVACFEGGERALKAELESRLARAVVERDERTFAACLRAVRTTCAAVRARRPAPGKTHYGEWFATAFGQEQTSLVAVSAKKRYQSFLQLLSRAAEAEEGEEGGACLTAHLSNKPFLPRAHLQTWKEYMALARARLNDIASSGGKTGSKRKRKLDE